MLCLDGSDRSGCISGFAPGAQGHHDNLERFLAKEEELRALKAGVRRRTLQRAVLVGESGKRPRIQLPLCLCPAVCCLRGCQKRFLADDLLQAAEVPLGSRWGPGSVLVVGATAILGDPRNF
jgi:hypothetical protein